MRGLMANPKKSTAGVWKLLKTQFLSNFKEGFIYSWILYFYTRARKGLAEYCFKNSGCWYLTRRCGIVSQDCDYHTEDWWVTLRGIEVEALKKTRKFVESLGERILGRVSFTMMLYNPFKPKN